MLLRVLDQTFKSTRPDIVIYIDIEPKIGIERKRGQNKINRLDAESLNFHRKVREGYLKLAKENSSFWHIIKGENEIQSVHKDIFEVLKEYHKIISEQ